MQSHLLADPGVEADMAQILATTAYECPTCYWKERDMKHVKGFLYPKRMRWEADVQRKCRGCGKLTFHCSAGPWVDGEKFDLKLVDL